MRQQRLRLQSYFGFSKMPFTKYMWATKMFKATGQKELLDGLNLWLDARGTAFIYGRPGVGKSITLRRFKAEIDDQRFDLFYLFNLRVTPLGFLRSLARCLSLPVVYQQSDLFDAISSHLEQYKDRTQKHPVIVFDDADGLSDRLLELLRSLSNFVMDSEDKCSFLLAATPRLASRLRCPQNEPLKQRIGFSHHLTAFTVDDTRRYVDFHLKRSEAPKELFSDSAVQMIFHLAKGLPRVINQIAFQALIRAAIKSKNRIDDAFLKQHVLVNSVFDANLDEA
jgi:type II secretory pathway predicted ATPase ExeA